MTTPSPTHLALTQILPTLTPELLEVAAEVLGAQDSESMQALGDEIATEYLFATEYP